MLGAFTQKKGEQIKSHRSRLWLPSDLRRGIKRKSPKVQIAKTAKKGGAIETWKGYRDVETTRVVPRRWGQHVALPPLPAPSEAEARGRVHRTGVLRRLRPAPWDPRGDTINI